jgi:hypothetical protein
MENAFYSLLIPQSWNLTGTGHPTIVVQNGSCNQLPPWHSTQTISDADAAKARVCDVPGASDKTFYLLAMPDCEKAAKRDIDHTPNSRLAKLWTRNPPLPPSPQKVPCPSNRPAFQLLPSTAQLDGTKWGGVTPPGHRHQLLRRLCA